jgi:hypothetical protein
VPLLLLLATAASMFDEWSLSYSDSLALARALLNHPALIGAAAVWAAAASSSHERCRAIFG